MARKGIDHERADECVRVNETQYLVSDGVARFRAETSVHFVSPRPPRSHMVRFLLAITNNSVIRAYPGPYTVSPPLSLSFSHSLSLLLLSPSLPPLLPRATKLIKRLSVCSDMLALLVEARTYASTVEVVNELTMCRGARAPARGDGIGVTVSGWWNAIPRTISRLGSDRFPDDRLIRRPWAETVLDRVYVCTVVKLAAPCCPCTP